MQRLQNGGIRWPLILLLAVASVAYIILRDGEKGILATQVKSNTLALGSAGQPGIIELDIHSPISLNFKSRDEVLRLRTEKIMRNRQLLTSPYVPTPAVFGQIADGAPWWGNEGIFYHGPGPHSIEGHSLQSRYLLNPFLLVAPEFHDDWQFQGTATEASPLPPYCAPQDLRWRTQDAYAEVTYAASCIAMRQMKKFDLVAFNASDFGLKYIFVSYAESKNVTKQNAPTNAYRNPQLIHKGGSCGYPGGCNNMSPTTPAIDGIQLLGLPAFIMVYLWKEQPNSVSQAPDMRFVIHFQ